MKNVHLDRRLMIVLAFLCNLQVCVTECWCRLRANRSTLFIAEGESISLQCVVQDCGLNVWTGEWGLTVGGFFTPLIPSPRLQLSNITISDKITHLLVNIHSLNQSDSGAYQCRLTEGDSQCLSLGHVTYVNVTTADESKQRKLSHRLLVCVLASLCFPLALGLTFCLSPRGNQAPLVPPRLRGTSTARVKPKAEVVYAAVILNRPREQKRPETREAITYSSLSFSQV